MHITVIPYVLTRHVTRWPVYVALVDLPPMHRLSCSAKFDFYFGNVVIILSSLSPHVVPYRMGIEVKMSVSQYTFSACVSCVQFHTAAHLC